MSADFIIEKKRGERFGQFGLANPCRSEKHERSDWAIGVLQTRPRAAHRGRDRLHRLRLANDALANRVFHFQELVALALQHLIDRNARPARDNLGYVAGGHRFVHENAAPFRLGRCKPPFEIWNNAVGEFAGALIFTPALRLDKFVAGRLKLLLELLLRTKLVLLGVPSRRQRRGFFFNLGKLTS